MIVERRKKLRDCDSGTLNQSVAAKAFPGSVWANKPVKKTMVIPYMPDLFGAFSFNAHSDWENDFAVEKEKTHSLFVYVFALLTGFLAFVLGCYLFTG